MPITALPTAPSRADPANFATRADAFLGALGTFATEANSLATTVNGYATAASGSAAAAAASAATCVPGGSNTQIQYNNSGVLGGNSNFTIAGTGVVTFGKDAIHNGVVVGKGTNSLSDNTALGKNTLQAINTGNQNTAVGSNACQSNTAGASNTGVGNTALLLNSTGNYNAALGDSALYSATGSNNTGIGTGAGSSISSGANNTVVGFLAAGSLSTGSNNTIIGANCTVTAGLANNIILADGAGVKRLTIDSNGYTTFDGTVKPKLYTVAGLPSAATAGNGARAHVSDASSPTFLATVAGGGAVSCPVFSNGSSWIVG